MTATIYRTDDGPVRILTIANPAKRNAFSGDMAPQLRSYCSRPIRPRPSGPS